jgi:hypothetical protein
MVNGHLAVAFEALHNEKPARDKEPKSNLVYLITIQEEQAGHSSCVISERRNGM